MAHDLVLRNDPDEDRDEARASSSPWFSVSRERVRLAASLGDKRALREFPDAPLIDWSGEGTCNDVIKRIAHELGDKKGLVVAFAVDCAERGLDAWDRYDGGPAVRRVLDGARRWLVARDQSSISVTASAARPLHAYIARHDPEDEDVAADVIHAMEAVVDAVVSKKSARYHSAAFAAYWTVQAKELADQDQATIWLEGVWQMRRLAAYALGEAVVPKPPRKRNPGDEDRDEARASHSDMSGICVDGTRFPSVVFVYAESQVGRGAWWSISGHKLTPGVLVEVTCAKKLMVELNTLSHTKVYGGKDVVLEVEPNYEDGTPPLWPLLSIGVDGRQVACVDPRPSSPSGVSGGLVIRCLDDGAELAAQNPGDEDRDEARASSGAGGFEIIGLEQGLKRRRETWRSVVDEVELVGPDLHVTARSGRIVFRYDPGRRSWSSPATGPSSFVWFNFEVAPGRHIELGGPGVLVEVPARARGPGGFFGLLAFHSPSTRHMIAIQCGVTPVRAVDAARGRSSARGDWNWVVGHEEGIWGGTWTGAQKPGRISQYWRSPTITFRQVAARANPSDEDRDEARASASAGPQPRLTVEFDRVPGAPERRPVKVLYLEGSEVWAVVKSDVMPNDDTVQIATLCQAERRRRYPMLQDAPDLSRRPRVMLVEAEGHHDVLVTASWSVPGPKDEARRVRSFRWNVMIGALTHEEIPLCVANRFHGVKTEDVRVLTGGTKYGYDGLTNLAVWDPAARQWLDWRDGRHVTFSVKVDGGASANPGDEDRDEARTSAGPPTHKLIVIAPTGRSYQRQEFLGELVITGSPEAIKAEGWLATLRGLGPKHAIMAAAPHAHVWRLPSGAVADKLVVSSEGSAGMALRVGGTEWKCKRLKFELRGGHDRVIVATTMDGEFFSRASGQLGVHFNEITVRSVL